MRLRARARLLSDADQPPDGPGRHGYNGHDGDTGNEHAFQFTDPNPVDIFGMAERAEAFMARSRNVGKPFFIQLS